MSEIKDRIQAILDKYKHVTFANYVVICNAICFAISLFPHKEYQED